MKKELLLIAAAALIAVTSCTKEESAVGSGSSSQSSSVDVINFTTNTTRVSTVVLDNLMDDDNGFKVYATYIDTGSDADSDSDDTDSWLIQGDSYIYNETDSEWLWSTSDHEWPTETANYPVTFYSFYATDLSGVTTTPATDLSTDSPLTASITIAEPDSQIDLLATATSATTKPSDGKLSITFDHILTKIDFGIIPGLGKTVYLATFSLNELENEGDYALYADTDSNTWSVTSDGAGAGYPLSDFSALDDVVGDESTATSLTSESGDSFMLLPQTTTEWVVATWAEDSGEIDNIEDTYIDMIYRATYGTEDYIGYTLAVDHPDYDEENSEHTQYENDALFVRVGYPLSTTWNQKKNYTYNIKIGTEDATNGYLLDDVYYDKDGDPTPFPIDIDKEIGEALSDGYIHFNVFVSGWNSDYDNTTIIE